MISRYEAYMDGVALSSLDDSIYVLDIQPAVVKPGVKTFKPANAPGAIVTRKDIERSAVTIIFEIHKYNPAERLAICQKVQKWADGSVLTTSDRTGQRLKGICEAYPAATAKHWTAPLSVTIVGYTPPYWENTTATTTTIAVEGTNTVEVPGNAPEAFVSATVTASYAITEMEFTVAGKTIRLEGLNVANGDVVSLGYNKQLLQIRHGTTSIVNKVTEDSADVLKVPCGESSAFSFSADGAAVCVYSVRGCWL